MLVDKTPLAKGRYHVFAWVYQKNLREAYGSRAGRYTPNHWTFKWLLRERRHRAAPDIKGLPVKLP